MAVIVFLGGINVGGRRTFRPSILARGLSDYDVVYVGAAGTFMVRQPGSQAKVRAELLRTMPFEAEVVVCDGRDLIRLEMKNPFETEPSRPDIVRFASILSRLGRDRVDIPFKLPPRGQWFVRVIASKKRFVFGVYSSRHEDDRFSWPDRKSLRCAGDHTQLEHNPCGRSDCERPAEKGCSLEPPSATLG
jgi:hypothetical protein